MLNLYIGYCQKLYTQHCHFLYIVNLLITPFHRETKNREQNTIFRQNNIETAL